MFTANQIKGQLPCVSQNVHVQACMYFSPRALCVLTAEAFPKHYPSNTALHSGGACALTHYITQGVVSRPNLSQWTIPLPEFTLCSEEEAGETKQTCWGSLQNFGGRIHYKTVYGSCSKVDVILFVWLDVWLSWYISGKDCHAPRSVRGWKRDPQKQPKGWTESKRNIFLHIQGFSSLWTHENVAAFKNTVK